ncbi:MAG: P-II family nitrogen regulator [Bacteroidota bacterium]|nr:P-II family nitrogen regulator [Bacteroidota bacterium]
MKKVEAIIRKSKFEDVKRALHEADIDFFTYWDVNGVGKEKEGHIFRGAVYEANRIQRRMLSIVVRDHNLQRTIDAITKSAWTGVIGDGKIFVSDVEDVIRIRTQETGPDALYLKEDEKSVVLS